MSSDFQSSSTTLAGILRAEANSRPIYGRELRAFYRDLTYVFYRLDIWLSECRNWRPAKRRTNQDIPAMPEFGPLLRIVGGREERPLETESMLREWIAEVPEEQGGATSTADVDFFREAARRALEKLKITLFNGCFYDSIGRRMVVCGAKDCMDEFMVNFNKDIDDEASSRQKAQQHHALQRSEDTIDDGDKSDAYSGQQALKTGVPEAAECDLKDTRTTRDNGKSVPSPVRQPSRPDNPEVTGTGLEGDNTTRYAARQASKTVTQGVRPDSKSQMVTGEAKTQGASLLSQAANRHTLEAKTSSERKSIAREQSERRDGHLDQAPEEDVSHTAWQWCKDFATGLLMIPKDYNDRDDE